MIPGGHALDSVLIKEASLGKGFHLTAFQREIDGPGLGEQAQHYLLIT